MKATRSSLVSMVLGLVLLAVGARGGERTNPRAMGMARTHVAASRGLESWGLNPANLLSGDSSLISIDLAPFGIHAGADVISLEIYRDYFTGVERNGRIEGVELSGEDKARILDEFGLGTGRISADAEVRSIGVSIRLGEHWRGALAMTDVIHARADVPRSYLEFFFLGNEPDSRFDFSDTRVQATWYRTYGVSAAYGLRRLGELRNVSFGGGLKFVHGFSYYAVDRYAASLVTSAQGSLTGTIQVRSRRAGFDPFDDPLSAAGRPAGWGLAIDAGVAADVTEFLRVACALSDAGSIRWTYRTVESIVDTTITVDDPFIERQRDAVESALRGRDAPAGSFSSPLPAVLRFGVLVRPSLLPNLQDLPDGFVLAMDYNQGLTSEMGGETTPRVSVGAEYPVLDWLKLRTGVSFGGVDHVNLGLGAGIEAGFFRLDIGTENATSILTPGSWSRFSFAAGIGLAF